MNYYLYESARGGHDEISVVVYEGEWNTFSFVMKRKVLGFYESNNPIKKLVMIKGLLRL